MSAGWVSYG